MKKLLLTLSIITTALLILTSCVSDISSNKLSANNSFTSEEANLQQESLSDSSEQQTNETTNEKLPEETESTILSEETTAEKQNEEVISPTEETTAQKLTNPQATQETTTAANTTADIITKEQAKQIALKHAGLSESAVSRYKIETDREKNSVTYEISFYGGNFEYEYEVNAVNGKILKSEKEAEKNVKPSVNTETTTAASSSDNLISKDKAKQIVLNHAELSEADISRYRIELDREINRITYDIDFRSGDFEYEYEIDATNGNILKSEKERIDD